VIVPAEGPQIDIFNISDEETGPGSAARTTAPDEEHGPSAMLGTAQTDHSNRPDEGSEQPAMINYTQEPPAEELGPPPGDSNAPEAEREPPAMTDYPEERPSEKSNPPDAEGAAPTRIESREGPPGHGSCPLEDDDEPPTVTGYADSSNPVGGQRGPSKVFGPAEGGSVTNTRAQAAVGANDDDQSDGFIFSDGDQLPPAAVNPPTVHVPPTPVCNDDPPPPAVHPEEAPTDESPETFWVESDDAPSRRETGSATEDSAPGIIDDSPESGEPSAPPTMIPPLPLGEAAGESTKPHISWHLPVTLDTTEERKEAPPADEPPPEPQDVRTVRTEGVASVRSFGSLPLAKILPFGSEAPPVEVFPRFAPDEAMAQLRRQKVAGLASGPRANARPSRPMRLSVPQ
jgi:hypothetical protein